LWSEIRRIVLIEEPLSLQETYDLQIGDRKGIPVDLIRLSPEHPSAVERSRGAAAHLAAIGMERDREVAVGVPEAQQGLLDRDIDAHQVGKGCLQRASERVLVTGNTTWKPPQATQQPLGVSLHK
jgi:hypothetical protein